MIDDPYKVLGVSPDASDDEIKRAYRRLAKQYHPDLNPGDETAAKKMQQVNAAYEQIKNPEKQTQSGSGYSGYDPFGSYRQQGYSSAQEGDPYLRSAYQYIRVGRYQEALNTLQNCTEHKARWYYLSALANNGLGNQVTALEHIRKAVSMEPDNALYLQTLEAIENGGTVYRRQASSYRGFGMDMSMCPAMCLCWFCSGGRCFPCFC